MYSRFEMMGLGYSAIGPKIVKIERESEQIIAKTCSILHSRSYN